MLDHLVDALINGERLTEKTVTELALLSQTRDAALRKIVEDNRAMVDDAVLETAERFLRESDTDDIERAGGGTKYPQQISATIAGMSTVLARDNLDMVDGAKRAFLTATAEAVTKINSGLFTSEQAIHGAVRKLEREGIPIITYRNARTGVQTVQNKVDVAVRRHVRTQISQDANRMTEERIRELDIDLVEVSSHPDARPSHAEWQGKCYSLKGEVVIDGTKYPDFWTSCMSGTLGDILGGVNCRHSYGPYRHGAPRAYSPNPQHPSGVPGSDIYEMEQHQRYLERQIREDKRELRGAQKVYEDDPKSLTAKTNLLQAQKQLRDRQAAMRQFINESNAKSKNPNVRVLTRNQRREWAGDMPKAKYASGKIRSMASSNEIKWPPKGIALTKEQRADLHAYARTRGIEISLPKSCDADPVVIRRYVDAADKVAAFFPELKGDDRKPLTIRVKPLPSGDFGFSPSKTPHIIDVNEAAVRNTDALSAEYGKLADSGWFVQGTTYESIIYHELGHRYSSRNRISGMRIARSIIGSKDSDYLSVQLRRRLSQYSAEFKNGQEIVSEVFSAWFSKTNNEFAEEFMNRLLDLR